MQEHEPAKIFDQQNAAGYDRRFEKLAAMKDALHLLMRLAFAELPSDARMLCAGAGTGAELFSGGGLPSLAVHSSGSRRTHVGGVPQKAREAGIANRCLFHEGYLETLPQAPFFHGATAILVSQFIMAPVARCRFFRQIADRLQPGGILVSADLAADQAKPNFESLFGLFLKSWRYSGLSASEVEKMSRAFGTKIALLPPEDLAELIAKGGFSDPVLFFSLC